MREYRVSIPRLELVAQVAAIWLVAIAGALAFSPTDAGTSDLIWKVVSIAFCVAGALYMVKVSREIDTAQDSLRVLVGQESEEDSDWRDSDRKAA